MKVSPVGFGSIRVDRLEPISDKQALDIINNQQDSVDRRNMLESIEYMDGKVSNALQAYALIVSLKDIINGTDDKKRLQRYKFLPNRSDNGWAHSLKSLTYFQSALISREKSGYYKHAKSLDNQYRYKSDEPGEKAILLTTTAQDTDDGSMKVFITGRNDKVERDLINTMEAGIPYGLVLEDYHEDRVVT